MNNLDQTHIETFRNYFLLQDKEIQKSIRANLNAIQLKHLYIIETGFQKNTAIEEIASKIESKHLISELKKLQADFQLLIEKEISISIKLVERRYFKKKFESIDLEENSQISDSEIKTSIKTVERKSIKQVFNKIDEESFIEKNIQKPFFRLNSIIKYAAAAVVVGIVFLGGYFLNKKDTDKNIGEVAKNENKKEIIKPEVEIIFPKIDEQISESRLLVPETFGFVKEKGKIFSLVVININKQIDDLNKIYSNEIIGKNSNGAGFGPRAIIINQKIDSLTKLKETYTFNATDKKIKVWTKNENKEIKILSTELSKNQIIYIKIKDNYFELKPTLISKKLFKLENKIIIEQLDKVIFQNL